MSNLILSTCNCGVICGSCVSGIANSGCTGESPDCPNTLAVTFTIPAWTKVNADCPDGTVLDPTEYPEWTGTITVTRADTSGNLSCKYSGSVTETISLFVPNCVPPAYGSTCTTRSISVELNRGGLNLFTSWALVDTCMISAGTVPTTDELTSTWQCGDPLADCNCRGVGVAIVDDICLASGYEHGFSIGYNSGEAECGDSVPCYTQYGGEWTIQNWWGRLHASNIPQQISSVTIS
jgi:hypothetical protein